MNRSLKRRSNYQVKGRVSRDSRRPLVRTVVAGNDICGENGMDADADRRPQSAYVHTAYSGPCRSPIPARGDPFRRIAITLESVPGSVSNPEGALTTVGRRMAHSVLDVWPFEGESVATTRLAMRENARYCAAASRRRTE